MKSKAEILKIVKRTANRVTSMSKAEILKIVKVIACVIGFGVLGTGIGIPAGYFSLSIPAVKSWCCSGGGGEFGFILPIFVAMLVFGILGVALGGYVGYRITRSKDK